MIPYFFGGGNAILAIVMPANEFTTESVKFDLFQGHEVTGRRSSARRRTFR
jgi:hypothetical protein